MKRTIEQWIQSRPTSDGVGVKLQRALSPGMRNIDPFLMLDEISSDNSADYIGGFPPHPHRGFETVSYMLQGKMRHKDHLGNEGVIDDGAVQWMTAGRGVIHSEMPEQTEGVLHGFQLWLNLPSAHKMKDAAYQEYQAEQFPVNHFGINVQSSLKVIAGSFEFDGKEFTGPVENIVTEAKFYDIDLKSDDDIDIATDKDHTVLLYCFEGEIEIEGKLLKKGQTAKTSPGETLSLTAKDDARLLYLSAKPIGEPVVAYGPFVMNTEQEIQEAIADYNAGRLTA